MRLGLHGTVRNVRFKLKKASFYACLKLLIDRFVLFAANWSGGAKPSSVMPHPWNGSGKDSRGKQNMEGIK